MLKFLYLRQIALFELVDLIFFIKSRFCFIPSTACDSVCSGCMGAGPEQCKACGSGYQFSEGTCTGMMLRLLTKHSFPGKVFKKSHVGISPTRYQRVLAAWACMHPGAPGVRQQQRQLHVCLLCRLQRGRRRQVCASLAARLVHVIVCMLNCQFNSVRFAPFLRISNPWLDFLEEMNCRDEQKCKSQFFWNAYLR